MKTFINAISIFVITAVFMYLFVSFFTGSANPQVWWSKEATEYFAIVSVILTFCAPIIYVMISYLDSANNIINESDITELQKIIDYYDKHLDEADVNTMSIIEHIVKKYKGIA